MEEYVSPHLSAYTIGKFFELVRTKFLNDSQKAGSEGHRHRIFGAYHWREIALVVLYRLLRNPTVQELRARLGFSTSTVNRHFVDFIVTVRNPMQQLPALTWCI